MYLSTLFYLQDMNYTALLKDELASLATYFNANELAYLALTAKIEQPLREKIAYRLQQRITAENPDLYCAREWHDTDIALIDKEGNVNRIVLIKSGYTADETNMNASMVGFYPKKIIDDLRKTAELGGNETKYFALLFYTHIDKPVPAHLKKIVKHDNSLNRAFKQQNAAQIIEEAQGYINHFFEQHRITTEQGCIEAGQCWDIEVKIYYWFMELSL